MVCDDYVDLRYSINPGRVHVCEMESGRGIVLRRDKNNATFAGIENVALGDRELVRFISRAYDELAIARSVFDDAYDLLANRVDNGSEGVVESIVTLSSLLSMLTREEAKTRAMWAC